MEDKIYQIVAESHDDFETPFASFEAFKNLNIAKGVLEVINHYNKKDNVPLLHIEEHNANDIKDSVFFDEVGSSSNVSNVLSEYLSLHEAYHVVGMLFLHPDEDMSEKIGKYLDWCDERYENDLSSDDTYYEEDE